MWPADASPLVSTFCLLARSVHATAACCDYLVERLDTPGEHTVHAVGLPAADTDDAVRDADDALNAARARLAAVATVETDRLDPVAAPENAATVLVERTREVEADAVVLASADSGVVGALLEGIDRPLVVVP